jgi:hypothetical protein
MAKHTYPNCPSLLALRNKVFSLNEAFLKGDMIYPIYKNKKLDILNKVVDSHRDVVSNWFVF